MDAENDIARAYRYGRNYLRGYYREWNTIIRESPKKDIWVMDGSRHANNGLNPRKVSEICAASAIAYYKGEAN